MRKKAESVKSLKKAIKWRGKVSLSEERHWSGRRSWGSLFVTCWTSIWFNLEPQQELLGLDRCIIHTGVILQTRQAEFKSVRLNFAINSVILRYRLLFFISAEFQVSRIQIKWTIDIASMKHAKLSFDFYYVLRMYGLQEDKCDPVK